MKPTNNAEHNMTIIIGNPAKQEKIKQTNQND